LVHQHHLRFTAGKKAEGNYWGEGATTLEWTLSSPPPFHQFETLPVIDDKATARPNPRPIWGGPVRGAGFWK
jgi:heme/copper-type cytochrome/quinol oxidase subunit 1